MTKQLSFSLPLSSSSLFFFLLCKTNMRINKPNKYSQSRWQKILNEFSEQEKYRTKPKRSVHLSELIVVTKVPLFTFASGDDKSLPMETERNNNASGILRYFFYLTADYFLLFARIHFDRLCTTMSARSTLKETWNFDTIIINDSDAAETDDVAVHHLMTTFMYSNGYWLCLA